jgi:hypothetical protein
VTHSRGANLRPPAPQARTLPKELSRQLIAGYSELLLRASGRPPQGSPSACVYNIYMDSTGCRPNSPCKALGFIPFQGPRLHTLQVRVFSNHVGVTTIERPDQGHLYPLGEPRDTCHSRGANLRTPALQARTLPKELSRQLIAGYSELLLRASGRPPQVLGSF